MRNTVQYRETSSVRECAYSTRDNDADRRAEIQIVRETYPSIHLLLTLKFAKGRRCASGGL